MPFRELIYRSLKNILRLLSIAIILLISEVLQILADDAHPKKSDAVVKCNNKLVTGRVTDSQTGEAMPGVTIVVKGLHWYCYRCRREILNFSIRQKCHTGIFIYRIWYY